MKVLLFGLMSLLTLPAFATWETNFEKAKQLAVHQNKNILLTFSGSDWCGPCIRLHREIFESDEFKNFADSSLVLIDADFPRAKKNQLSKEQQKENNFLADRYNANGNFPYTILLNASGKVLKIWDGYPKMTPGEFIDDIKLTTTGNR